MDILGGFDMEIQIRKSEDRGKAEYSWLKSLHTFSFDTYYDLEQMGFGSLRVINEDVVQPDEGFGRHGHRNMEIISYIVEGELTHQDSTGVKHVVKAGGVQKMSAGRGVLHSEMNDGKEPVHFFQMWIIPDELEIAPSYVEYMPEESGRKDQWQTLASNQYGAKVPLQADAILLTTELSAGKEISYSLKKDRKGWLQIIDGELEIDGQKIQKGDGARIWDTDGINFKAGPEGVRVLLFDLA